MDNNKNKEVIGAISPHTIMKFNLIEAYIIEWSEKLLNSGFCNHLVFIDCMCNSGEYVDKYENIPIKGTPVRAAVRLKEVADAYPQCQVDLYFNDYSEEKIEHLKNMVPKNTNNFHIYYDCIDGNELLKQKATYFDTLKKTSFLLLYDPFEADIDWLAIEPYINMWGEVIINHMVSDTIRAIGVAKKPETVAKYERTYKSDIEKLLALHNNNRDEYAKIIENIIKDLKNKDGRKLYVASFPFFIRTNTIEYMLVHCTTNIEGFKLFKKCAWKTFDGKSSAKNTHGKEIQPVLDFTGGGTTITESDNTCYNLNDVAVYLIEHFKNRKDVPLQEIWDVLDMHPVFPSDGFKKTIKQILKEYPGVVISQKTISF